MRSSLKICYECAVRGDALTKEEVEYAYCAVLQYDGRNYHGWQRLRDHPTLQAATELAIEGAFARRAAVAAAGRTDRGAHAEGQVVSFCLSEELAPEAVADALNQRLPPDIRVLHARAVPSSFHARTSALGKVYQYRIASAVKISSEQRGRVWHLPKQLDIKRMQQAAQALVGRQDFASFATKSRFARGPTIRELHEASVAESNDLVVVQLHADSFLYHMVRNVVRALVKVGEGRFEPERIAEILAARDRAASPGSAPASGLYLMRVIYEA